MTTNHAHEIATDRLAVEYFSARGGKALAAKLRDLDASIAFAGDEMPGEAEILAAMDAIRAAREAQS